MILVVGHFGTLYSYATVAGRVAEALKARGLLAGCNNLDDGWHPRWEALRYDNGRSTHSFIVAAPNHYVSGYAEACPGRSAIFVSPNTRLLAAEHVETISKFDLAVAPSIFCATTLDQQSPGQAITVLPLGSPVSSRRNVRSPGEPGPVRALHFTSDQAWPSRKGTETLLKAWACRRPGPDAVLTIHGPPSLRKDALYAIADLGIDETVTYEPSGKLGTSDEDLAALYDKADLIIAPSRSEGFGMMLLASLVAGVPLLTTCNTGHAEFLNLRPGVWLTIPTPTEGPIAFESGNAPVVDFETLTETLSLALTPFAREWMLAADLGYGEAKMPGWGTWDWALAKWVERFKEWLEETS